VNRTDRENRTRAAGERARAVAASALVAAILAIAGPATAHVEEAAPALVIDNGRCKGGDAIEPTQVLEGSFASDLQGSYVMVPFDVPAGTTQVRVKYCWDEPDAATDGSKHTIDLGLWQPGPTAGLWEAPQFRGWGGSSHPDVTITAQGFSTEAEYLEDPKGHVPGRTTRGFLPGEIPAGAWAAELGVAAVVPREQGDADGRVRWRLEIALSSDPAFAAEPWGPTPYDEVPASTEGRWWAGDMHVHAEHSALGDATMTEVFDYAFSPLGPEGAGLDFVTLTDYVTPSAWGEIGRYQAAHPGKLVVRSSEIITYRGHTNAHASLVYADHRTGPVLVRDGEDDYATMRPARPASEIFDVVREAGGVTQINHPTIFPSSNPSFRRLCRGCPWDFTEEETDFSKVDAIEIQTGPAAFGDSPNPFTLTAIEFWEKALDQGHRIAAVGASDSHRAGRTADPTQSPIGKPTTMVWARELSEEGVKEAVRARRTKVKLLGGAGPDVSLEAEAGGRRAIVGDAIEAAGANFVARVSGVPSDGRAWTLHVLRDGFVERSFPVASPGGEFRFAGESPSRWRLQLQRGAVVAALTSPIWLDPPARAPLLQGLGGGGGLPTIRRGLR